MSVATSLENAVRAVGTLPPGTERLLGAWTESAALVYCRDFSGRILAANRAFSRRFGCTPTEIIERSIGTLLHQDDASAHRDALEALAQPPHRCTTTSRWLTPQGWRWIEWEESLSRDLPETCIRAVGHDITRQRAAEEQYFKLSRAVEQSPVAIVITDAQGNVQYVNAKFTEATGHTLEQLLDREQSVLRDGHPDEASFRQFWDSVQAGREWRGDLRRDGPDGRKIWESVQVSPLRNPAGEITHLLCLREDITARKALEEQLRQAQKMESLGTMAGGIAHDFNNIIAVINGYAELALLNGNEPGMLQRSLLEIRNASRRASGLVRQILTFSRKAEVRFAPLDLNQLVRELMALLSETFPRNIACNLSLHDALPPLLADQNQIQQIILNLCVNARDAMPSGGTLTLATSIAEGADLPASLAHRRPCACLAISDTGTGMTPEVRARMFEPFFTTKSVHKGTGLGLAVVYGIVTAHEGTIEVESTPGHGSTFRIYLPLTDAPVPTAPIARAGDFPAGTESLLVVDDESPLRELLHSVLTRKGYQVTCAADGLEAIEQIAQNRDKFDAVLLDLNMPGASGIEVARIVQSTRPDLPLIVITGHLDQEARAAFERMGRDTFVKKPYALDELGRVLRKTLERAKSR